ncbi:MAG TPA: cupin domain-containing protein [Solirubrobacteraceae bacterium]
MGVTHFDEAPARDYALGHLRNRWTLLGEAAGSETIGVRRIQIEPGGWSTPAHEHGRSEEIFYVLGGRGVSWQRGRTAAIGAGDCIVYLARRGEHTVHATEPLDLLAFGTRAYDEATRLPRLGISTLGGRAVESVPGPPDGTPIQFLREGELGPPELPQPDPAHPRPRTIVGLEDVEPDLVDRSRVARARRELGRAAGARLSSLNWVRVVPGRLAHPQQCHTLEEKIFVVLSGSGALLLDDEEIAVGPGHVIGRPAGTGVAHTFRAAAGEELTFLAYGTREPGDICYFPRSGKIALRGLGVVARLQAADYWEGED